MEYKGVHSKTNQSSILNVGLRAGHDDVIAICRSIWNNSTESLFGWLGDGGICYSFDLKYDLIKLIRKIKGQVCLSYEFAEHG